MVKTHAYVLTDSGASENFVSRDFVRKLGKEGVVEAREEGTMTVLLGRAGTTAP